jgi:methylated-DNA-[protein]-cysteine S-methyltransferase
MTVYTFTDSPIGRLLLAADEAGLRRIEFPEGRHPQEPHADWREARAPFTEALRQLDAYFAGTLRRFELPLAPAGTPFQLAVWHALCDIPYGQTLSYGALALRLGKPGASRAVGLANGRNPLPIVVPCHRVIGSDGSLTGFGGGLPTKRHLLRLEGVQLPCLAEVPGESQQELFARPA